MNLIVLIKAVSFRAVPFSAIYCDFLVIDLWIFALYNGLKFARCDMINVLFVDDDKELVDLMIKYYRNGGEINAVGVTNAADALLRLSATSFDIVVTDVMMPEISGYTLTERIRSIDKNVPIVFLSAKDDIMSKQMGYSLEIDDYVVKPVDLTELTMKLKAIYRRTGIKNDNKLSIGNFEMDSIAMTASINGKEIALTNREFRILNLLLLYPQQAFSRSKLLDDFWSDDTDSSLRAVDVYITRLRDKLADCDGFKIVTVRGVGYKAVLK